MRIGEKIRYGKPKEFPSTVAAVDGLPNWWHVTAPPDGSGLPALTMTAGINAPARVDADGGNRVPVVLLRSSPHRVGTELTPWQDVHRPDLGYSRYFGDNKPSAGSEAHASRGNKLLREVWALSRGDRSDRLATPPVLIFEAFRTERSPKGQVALQGLGVISRVELVMQRDPKSGLAFANYRYDLVLLDLVEDDDEVSWDWVNDRRDAGRSNVECLWNAPRAWKRWVDGGDAVLENLQRRVLRSHVVPEAEQRPVARSAEAKLLRSIYDWYEGKKHRFEALADFVTSEVLREQGIEYRQGWITRGSGDGGVDFVGRIDLDPDGSFPSSRLVLLGQAKCETLGAPTNGNHIARLAARLRRGWIGAYVTTSYFSKRVQQEVLEDRYPVLLIHGARVAEVVNRHLTATGMALDKLLTELDDSYAERIAWGDPDQVLL